MPLSPPPPLIECVPNFSEGRHRPVIDAIAEAITAVEGVRLLDVDPGASANRTVMTFVGAPEPVIEAAFRAIARAAELIDMRKHSGTHPRMGATDVCPLVPIQGISAEALVAFAERLGQWVGRELGIPVYLYEKAARQPARRNLATIRAGEYEGFAQKIQDPAWAPDFGPARFNPKAGQTVIGVRDFLVAYNINLNTRSVRRANAVAFDIREKGRIQTVDGTPGGEPVRDAQGQPVRQPGRCQAVKAIGWYIPEYGQAQVSTNLTDLSVTPLHMAFEAARESANRRGMRVTGSELVGLVPRQCLLDAAYYFLAQQGVGQGLDEAELIAVAVQSLGLDDLGPFDPQQKVIEYRLAAEAGPALAELSLRTFTQKLASDTAALGGGAAAALAGAIGAALGTMVANLSANKRGREAHQPTFNAWARQGQQLKDALLHLVTADSAAYSALMDAQRLPQQSAAAQRDRQAAIEAATRQATMVAHDIMTTALACYPLLEAVAQEGPPEACKDAAIGALCVHAAVAGAALKVDLAALADTPLKAQMADTVPQALAESSRRQAAIWELVQATRG